MPKNRGSSAGSASFSNGAARASFLLMLASTPQTAEERAAKVACLKALRPLMHGEHPPAFYFRRRQRKRKQLQREQLSQAPPGDPVASAAPLPSVTPSEPDSAAPLPSAMPSEPNANTVASAAPLPSATLHEPDNNTVASAAPLPSATPYEPDTPRP
jgi:hypothetical protein